MKLISPGTCLVRSCRPFLLLLLGALPVFAQQSDFNAIKTKAEKGDAKAQTELGQIYEVGQGVKQDYAEAVKWYRKAAEQDYDEAENLLGDMYAGGLGVPNHSEAELDKEAANWYRKAAEQGNAKAQSNLGGMYRFGHGVPQDYVEAYKWFNLAASSGNT